MDSLRDLLESLAAIEAADHLPNDDLRYLHDIQDKQSNLCIAQAIEYANTALIRPNGHCNWEAIRHVKMKGYPVYAVEKDSWGWLSGGIQTKKGILVYG